MPAKMWLTKALTICECDFRAVHPVRSVLGPGVPWGTFSCKSSCLELIAAVGVYKYTSLAGQDRLHHCMCFELILHFYNTARE